MRSCEYTVYPQCPSGTFGNTSTAASKTSPGSAWARFDRLKSLKVATSLSNNPSVYTGLPKFNDISSAGPSILMKQFPLQLRNSPHHVRGCAACNTQVENPRVHWVPHSLAQSFLVPWLVETMSARPKHCHAQPPRPCVIGRFSSKCQIEMDLKPKQHIMRLSSSHFLRAWPLSKVTIPAPTHSVSNGV